MAIPDVQTTTKANGKEAQYRARQWWAELNRKGHEDRASLARLRRCHSPVDALAVPATFGLLTRLKKPAWREHDTSWEDRVAVTAIVLAHIRADDPQQRIARAIGRATLNDDKAPLSEARFRRFMQAQGTRELLSAMVRMVKFTQQKKQAVNVADAARTVLFWGEATKRRWAFDYYAAYSARPPDGPQPSPHP